MSLLIQGHVLGRPLSDCLAGLATDGNLLRQLLGPFNGTDSLMSCVRQLLLADLLGVVDLHLELLQQLLLSHILQVVLPKQVLRVVLEQLVVRSLPTLRIALGAHTAGHWLLVTAQFGLVLDLLLVLDQVRHRHWERHGVRHGYGLDGKLAGLTILEGLRGLQATGSVCTRLEVQRGRRLVVMVVVVVELVVVHNRNVLVRTVRTFIASCVLLSRQFDALA